MLKDLECRYCDTKFSVEISANFSVICPCCKRDIFLECEYGYGPVTPCRIYLGSETAGIVDCEGNNYYLTINSKKIVLNETYLYAISEAQQIVKKHLHILRPDENIDIVTSRGALCFFGDWLGRAYIYHKIIHTSYDGEILEILFDHRERLLVYQPENIASTRLELMIEKAKKVKWMYIPDSMSAAYTTITYTTEGGNVTKQTKDGIEYLETKEPFYAVYIG